MTREDAQAALEKIYGKPGPPDDGHNVGSAIMAYPQPKPKRTPLLPGDTPWTDDPPRVLDALGRPLPHIKERQKQMADRKSRTVTLMRDHTLEYPQLWLQVYVEGPPSEAMPFATMLARAQCKKAHSPEDADLVIFAGGVDVDPQLYGEERHNHTERPDPKRDSDDMALYVKCLELGIPMVGICRGAQFLHVMNGGKLYQHVDNHYGPHPMWDINQKKMIEKISSVHHQMVIENTKGGMEIIATSNKARNRWRNRKINDVGTMADIEAFFYRDTLCVGIQGHPEYSGYNYFTKWSLDLIQELIVYSPDVVPIDGKLRMKPDLIVERDNLAKISVVNRPKQEVN